MAITAYRVWVTVEAEQDHGEGDYVDLDMEGAACSTFETDQEQEALDFGRALQAKGEEMAGPAHLVIAAKRAKKALGVCIAYLRATGPEPDADLMADALVGLARTLQGKE